MSSIFEEAKPKVRLMDVAMLDTIAQIIEMWRVGEYTAREAALKIDKVMSGR